jgi:preprotein translocase subunit SecE
MSFEALLPVLIMVAFAVLFIWVLPRLKGGT